MIRIEYAIGNARIFAKLNALKGDTERAIRKSWYYIGRDLKRDAKKYIMEKPKSGRIYTVYRNGKPRQHQASAYGESPANLTGFLRKSIDFVVRGFNQMEFGSYAKYAEYLDSVGSRQNKSGTDMNRPFLKKAIIANQENAKTHFGNQIQKELNRLS